ncbi:helix-turn-helix domain-containing protein [Empedobacter tilapiae]|uniref:Helix-turn-helix domain-containing protein n=1 Tax=Empedobacter tilapiae TaxID=2491114 RepID=A0A4Z1ASY3_9FLAO|nr:helix-turn-helix domain-containing protein [Empedobacter tilapiae]TGN21893.1 helix-turn-helix domain-containing protein [Empedobacter tilapiae]
MEKSSPNYKQIFKDILDRKYPEKRNACENILNKTTLSIVDVIEINAKIFGIAIINDSKKFRSYKKSDILKILEYQKEKGLNNSQLANHFRLSRNTVAKWKKLFLV